MKFDVLNRFTGDVQFTAEIKTDSTSKSFQLGLAVRWAIKNNADLRNADLRNADLRNADLRNADLRNADLRNADLRNAALSDANLWNADLRSADLRNADLWNANLWNASGNLKYIKTMQIDGWPISYTAVDMQIGCQRHPIEKWERFRDLTIDRMDTRALAWWKIWKPIIFQIIETSPAEPTGKEKS